MRYIIFGQKLRLHGKEPTNFWMRTTRTRRLVNWKKLKNPSKNFLKQSYPVILPYKIHVWHSSEMLSKIPHDLKCHPAPVIHKKPLGPRSAGLVIAPYATISKFALCVAGTNGFFTPKQSVGIMVQFLSG